MKLLNQQTEIDSNQFDFNLSFIKRTLKSAGLAKPHRKRQKGASRYQHYPATLISGIGSLIVEIDFLERYMSGHSSPLNFISFSCKKLKLKQFKRILAQTGSCAKQEIEWFCNSFFIPDCFKMDNGAAFVGSISAKRSLSQIVKLFLQKKIIPIFTAPRKPWNNGSVEGSNSVFARNFWNKFNFSSAEEIDEKLKLFNQANIEYSDYQPSEIKRDDNKEFIPKIYFIRKVYEDQQNDKGKIEILNDKINLPKEYINLFTLSEWNLKTEMLTVYFEKEQQSIIIKKVKFKINKKSRDGCPHFI